MSRVEADEHLAICEEFRRLFARVREQTEVIGRYRSALLQIAEGDTTSPRSLAAATLYGQEVGGE